MTELFLPEDYVKKSLPQGFFSKKLLTRKFTIKDVYYRALVKLLTINKKDLRASLKKITKFYADKVERLKDEEIKNPILKALNNEKLLKERVYNLVVWEESQRLKEENKGKKYIWLPSSSKEPRPEHQLRYGKIYTVGDGIFPGEDYGCKCGALILDEPENDDRITLEQKNAIECQKDFDNNKRVLNELNKLLENK